jgi:uncharacterized delta-60 repeat protein
MKNHTTRALLQSSLLTLFTVASLFSLPVLTPTAPGDLDPTFSDDGKLTDFLSRGNDWARAVAIQPDGKIVVAGSSLDDFAVARYNTDGSLDTTFGSGGKVTTDINSSYDWANAIAIQQDGKIVVAGKRVSPSNPSQPDFALVRYKSDGSLDTSFGSNGKVTTDIDSGAEEAYSVAVHTDGKIVAGGRRSTYDSGGSNDFAVVRYNTDGSLDTTFDSDGKVTTDFSVSDIAYSVALHPDGKIVAAGRSGIPSTGGPYFTLVRYNVDGSLDSSFDGDGKVTTQVGSASSEAHSVAIQPDGKIVAAGSAVSGWFGLVRYTSNGSVESVSTIQMSNSTGAESVAIQPDGKIVAAGISSSSFAIVRLNANFSIDTTFGTNGSVTTPIGSYAWAHQVAVQTDGKIVAAGYSGGTDSDIDFAVARYNANGSLDTSFDGDGKVTTDFGFFQGNALYDTAIQADGKIVAVGVVYISNVYGWSDFVLLRYNSDGSPDTTFGSGTGKVRTDMGSRGEQAHSVAIQPDGKIVVAGESSDQDDNSCCFALARYNVDGSLDTTFGGGGKVITGTWGISGAGSDVVIQPDGKIVAVGNSSEFNYPNGGFAVYRYNSNGSLDTSFDGDGRVITPIGSFHAFAKTVTIQPDGKIVAAGFSIDSLYRKEFAVVRYNGNGSVDTTFDRDGIVTTQTSQQDEVYSSVLQPDRKIIIAGSNETGFALIRYNTNGSLDTTFGAGGVVTTQLGLGSAAHAVALQPDGKIVASGTSIGIGDSGDFAVVRYNANGSLDTVFSGDGITTADFDNSTDNAYGLALDNAGRAVVVGESDGSFAIARFSLTAPPSTPFDFDGDRRADVSVFRPSDRTWYLNRSTNGFSATQFGLSSDKITPADFDGDGKTDIAVYRDGTWWQINSSNSTVIAVPFGLASDIPVPADYSGDGRDELAVYRGGTWWMLNLANGQVSTVQFGLASDKLVPADYDGDGLADQAVYRNGEWHLNRSTQGYGVVNWGLATDKPVPADYDGDGKTDPAVYRDGTWYLLQSLHGWGEFNWGISTDIPAPADYDGDSRTDAAVYRNGIWYLRQSTNGIAIQQFGLTSDKPVPAAFLP